MKTFLIQHHHAAFLMARQNSHTNSNNIPWINDSLYFYLGIKIVEEDDEAERATCHGLRRDEGVLEGGLSLRLHDGVQRQSCELHTEIKRSVDLNTEGFTLLHTRHHSLSHTHTYGLMWEFLEGTGVELKFVSIKDESSISAKHSGSDLRSGCRAGSLEGSGRRPPATWQWSPDLLCWWNPPRTSQFHWQETLKLS